MSLGRIQAERLTLAGLADIISVHVDRPVVDETRLTPKCHVALKMDARSG
jgi:uncharacterized protein (TIGR03435 family)